MQIIKRLNRHKYLRSFFVLFFLIFYLWNNLQVSAHNAYFLQITYDEGGYQFSASVSMDAEGSSDSKHAEEEAGDYLKYINSNHGDEGHPWENPVFGVTSDSYEVNTYNDQLTNDIDGGESSHLYYTFPPIHVAEGSWFFGLGGEDGEDFGDDVGDANSKDMQLAYRINDNLIQHFNSLLEQIRKSQEWQPDGRKFLLFATDLANKAWNVSTGTEDSATIEYVPSKISSESGLSDEEKTTIEIRRPDYDDETFQRVKAEDMPEWAYLEIEIQSDIYTSEQIANEENIDWYVAFLDKGYCEPGKNTKYTVDTIGTDYEPQTARSEEYRTSCSTGGRDNDTVNNTNDVRDFEWFGWKSVVLQADHLLVSQQISSSNASELADGDGLGHTFAKAFTKIYSTVTNFLGLSTIEELVLAEGSWGNRSYMGLFPNAWLPVINFVNVILQLIVWSLLAFSLTKLLFKRSLATMNIGEKIALMDGMKNIIISAIMMGIWPLLFMMLGRFNYFLVKMFGAISPFSETFSISMIASTNILILFGMFYVLVITIYFNIVYIIRSITLAFLYALSPLFIFTISLGGSWMQYFNVWLKELIGHIYIQAFQALMVAFFSYLTKAGNGTFGLSSILTQFVILTSFIPISSFIKNSVFQMGDGVMNQLAQAHQTNLTSRLGKGLGSEKGGGSGGGGGAGGGAGVGSAAVGGIESRNRQMKATETQNTPKELKGGQANMGKEMNFGGKAKAVAVGLAKKSPVGKAVSAVKNSSDFRKYSNRLAGHGNEAGIGKQALATGLGLASVAKHGLGHVAKGSFHAAQGTFDATMGNQFGADYHWKKVGNEIRDGVADSEGRFKEGYSGVSQGDASGQYVQDNHEAKSADGKTTKTIDTGITKEGHTRSGGTVYNVPDIGHNVQNANRAIAGGSTLELDDKGVVKANSGKKGNWTAEQRRDASTRGKMVTMAQYAANHREEAQKNFGISYNTATKQLVDERGLFSDATRLEQAYQQVMETSDMNQAARSQDVLSADQTDFSKTDDPKS